MEIYTSEEANCYEPFLQDKKQLTKLRLIRKSCFLHSLNVPLVASKVLTFATANYADAYDKLVTGMLLRMDL